MNSDKNNIDLRRESGRTIQGHAPEHSRFPSAPHRALSSNLIAPHHNTHSTAKKPIALNIENTLSISSASSGFSNPQILTPSNYYSQSSSFATSSVSSRRSFDLFGTSPTSRSLSNSAPSSPLGRSKIVHRKSTTENTFLSPSQLALLKEVCSNKLISARNTEIWERILVAHKFPRVNSEQDAYDLEMATFSLSIELAANNIQTKNFNSLLLHCLSQLRRFLSADANQIVPIEAYNSLFLVRVFTKHFVGNLNVEEIHRQFEGIPESINKETIEIEREQITIELDQQKLRIDPEIERSSQPRAELLIDYLLQVVRKIQPNANYSTYELYLECLNTLLVLLSTQIHQPSAATTNKNYFLNVLLAQFSDIADEVVHRLLVNFIEQKPPPSASSGMVYSAVSYLFSAKSSSPSASDLHPVADRSALLLLLLAAQSRIQPDGTSAYRAGISRLQDAHAVSGNEYGKNFTISFRDLYHVLCHRLHSEENTLILYLMIAENSTFRVYVLSRTDPETLMLPILKLLYEAMENKAHYSHTYILLTILLVFSQDEVFNESIQRVVIPYQTWFTERALKTISLGGLVVLVLIRTIQFNLASHRDVYYHTNCLATLANLSSSIQDMHPYVAQRMISLFDMVAKRYHKLLHRAQLDGTSEEDPVVSVYADIVCLVLEIINSILTRQLKRNIQFVYALVHRKDLFHPFQLHPRFAELIANIENVINYFHARVSEANLRAPSTEEVVDLMEQAARTWPPNRLQAFAELKFQYEEKTEAHEFFCPYVWSLIYRATFIWWDEKKARILEDYREKPKDDAAATPLM
ncbi:uncharacterized protein VTP21DRAFT_8634 [Calcarisporiella thermophila]|uniref:uncharacterized protein n=1 Tax=Calcarisporiella thermophila TaxID=911321 RepID=UPI0037446AE5